MMKITNLVCECGEKLSFIPRKEEKLNRVDAGYFIYFIWMEG